MLIQVAVLVQVCLLDELQDVVVTDVYVQVLVEDWFYLVQTHQTSLFTVKQSEHIQGLLLSSSSEEPFFCYQFYHLVKGEGIFVLVGTSYLVFDLFSIHLGEGKVPEDASEILTIDVSWVVGVIECEGIFDLVFLNEIRGTMSSVSLLLTLAFLPPLVGTFFLKPLISYKIIAYLNIF